MIVSRHWLSDFVPLGDKAEEDLALALNTLGIEVARTARLRVPDGVVVAKLLAKSKHPNATRLSLCWVDAGEGQPRQIVCGAPNIASLPDFSLIEANAAGQGRASEARAGQVAGQDQVGELYLPLALPGTTLPGGLVIKPSRIRGEESQGMLCSASELGLGEVRSGGEGIMFLDPSIGELVPGLGLNSLPCFDDVIIEIELTPNRGDWLGVCGVARDLAAFFDLPFKERLDFKESENFLGIGRILRLSGERGLGSFYAYRAIELACGFALPLLPCLRLALAGVPTGDNELERLRLYATHSTGVIFSIYDLAKLCASGEANIQISRGEVGESVVSCEGRILGVSGIYQAEETVMNGPGVAIIEASFTQPSLIAAARDKYKGADEDRLYRSLRGSQTMLDLGLDFLIRAVQGQVKIYSSAQQILDERELPLIALDIPAINALIGVEFHKDEILKILKKLGFELLINAEQVSVRAPSFRHDIENLADICEELVRIRGIDSIPSRPLVFAEKNRSNEGYERYLALRDLRYRAVGEGYFESVHYVLDSSEDLARLGLEPVSLRLINPISAELNVLRPSLLNQLIRAASLNAKNQKRLIKLFSAGEVFIPGPAGEASQASRLALIHSGLRAGPGLGRREENVGFFDFLAGLKRIIGDFELGPANLPFLSPYEQASILKNGTQIGLAGRLHMRIQVAQQLPVSFVCELDSVLLGRELKFAREYSTQPCVSRDLSLLTPINFPYSRIRKAINGLEIPILESLQLIDLYRDETLAGQQSLTLALVFRAMDRTLAEAEVAGAVDEILRALLALGLSLRQ